MKARIGFEGSGSGNVRTPGVCSCSELFYPAGLETPWAGVGSVSQPDEECPLHGIVTVDMLETRLKDVFSRIKEVEDRLLQVERDTLYTRRIG